MLDTFRTSDLTSSIIKVDLWDTPEKTARAGLREGPDTLADLDLQAKLESLVPQDLPEIQETEAPKVPRAREELLGLGELKVCVCVCACVRSHSGARNPQ
jgi:hypothetical protein